MGNATRGPRWRAKGATWVGPCSLWLLATVAPSLFVTTAHALPPQPGLNWVRLPGAEGCIGAQALADRVEQRLGRSVFGPPAVADLFVDGVAEPAPDGGYRARLWVSDRKGAVLGERTLHTPTDDCRDLDGALTLVIAVTLYPKGELGGGGIALDPQVSADLDVLFEGEPSELDPSELPVATEEATPEPPEPPMTAGQATTQPLDDTSPGDDHNRWRIGADMGAHVAVGALPGVLPGGFAGMGIEKPGLLRVEAQASVWPTRAAETDNGGGRTEFSMWLVDTFACSDGLAFLLDGRLCLGARLGSLQTTPLGFAVSRASRRRVLAEGVFQFLLRRPLVGDLHYRLALALGVPFRPRQYVYSTPEDPNRLLFRTPAVNGRLSLGLGWDF